MSIKSNKFIYSILFGSLMLFGSQYIIEATEQDSEPVELQSEDDSIVDDNDEVIDSNDDSTSDTEVSNEPSDVDVSSPSVNYTVHAQDIGWQETKQEEEVAGTTGKSKRLEAIQIELENKDYEGSVNYQTHVQDIGWQSSVKDGTIAGTTGQSKRVEAIKIWLTGTMADYYSIQYRVHVQDIGWQDWVQDGIMAGTTGLSKRIEALQIRLINLATVDPEISYSAHVQNDGWKSNVSSGQTAGTTGQSKRLEALTISLNKNKYSGDILYQTHVQGIGWQATVKNGEIAGTTGQSKRVEALKVLLSGDISNYYSVYYRVHTSDFGWLDWVQDGLVAGTSGLSKGIEAIQVVFVEKNTTPSLSSSSEVSSIIEKVGSDNGTTVYGWKNINGSYYYFDSDSGKLYVKQYLNKDEKIGYVNSYGKLMPSNNGIYMEGIDISQWNGDIDLTQYQNNFVIIRVAWGTNMDTRAIRNIQLCEQLNIPYGVYLYSYALSVEDAQAEASYMLNILNNYCSNVRVGVWYDMEDEDNYKKNRGALTSSLMTSMCNTFCSTLQNAGYYTGVYTSSSWFDYYLPNLNSNIPKWVANWGTNNGTLQSNMSSYGYIHQYTSTPLDKDVLYAPLSVFKL